MDKHGVSKVAESIFAHRDSETEFFEKQTIYFFYVPAMSTMSIIDFRDEAGSFLAMLAQILL